MNIIICDLLCFKNFGSQFFYVCCKNYFFISLLSSLSGLLNLVIFQSFRNRNFLIIKSPKEIPILLFFSRVSYKFLLTLKHIKLKKKNNPWSSPIFLHFWSFPCFMFFLQWRRVSIIVIYSNPSPPPQKNIFGLKLLNHPETKQPMIKSHYI